MAYVGGGWVLKYHYGRTTEDKQRLWKEAGAGEWGERRKGRLGSWSLVGLPTIFRCNRRHHWGRNYLPCLTSP